MQPGVLKAGVTGAFHYLSSAVNWKPQADFFIGLMAGKYNVFAWDVEKSYNTNSGIFINGILPAIEYIAKTTKKAGLFYMNPDIWGTWYKPIQEQIINFLARTDINIGLWIAHYWYTPDPNAQPNYWTVSGAENMPRNWKIWQYDCNGQGGLGHQYGVGSAGLDLNVFNGTVDDLHKWVGNVPQPAPTPTPSTYPQYVTVVMVNVRSAAYKPAQGEKDNLIGTLPKDTSVYVDTYISGGYSHFQPIPEFTNGGFIATQFLKKV